MLFHDFERAPNPRRVRIYLAEKDIEVPTRQVDMLGGEQRQPPYLEKNPTGGIPILELEDGTVIAESIAICRYFEALHPDPPLFGSNPEEIAIIDMWLRRIELNIMMTVGMVWVHGHELTAGLVNQVREIVEPSKARAYLGYKIFNDQLAKNEFIAGDTYSVADAVALATFDFATELVGVPLKDSHTHIKRWHETVSSRPSAKA